MNSGRSSAWVERLPWKQEAAGSNPVVLIKGEMKMSVCCRILLPDNVRVRDVAKVIGVLSGKKPVESSEGFVDVSGVKVGNYGEDILAECAKITVSDIDGEALAWRNGCSMAEVMFHFEPDGGRGRLMIPPSTAFWIAIGVRLIDFFGGWLKYQDCTVQEFDLYVVEKNNDANCPGNAYLQKRILNLKMLGPLDYELADEKSAYRRK